MDTQGSRIRLVRLNFVMANLSVEAITKFVYDAAHILFNATLKFHKEDLASITAESVTTTFGHVANAQEVLKGVA